VTSQHVRTEFASLVPDSSSKPYTTGPPSKKNALKKMPKVPQLAVDEFHPQK